MLGAAVCLTQGEAMAYLGAVCWVSFSEDAFPLSIIYTYTSHFPAFCRAVHMVGVLFLLISFCVCFIAVFFTVTMRVKFNILKL